MTNLNSPTDHNILGSSHSGMRAPTGDRSGSVRSTEGGYTLVALLAMMTIVALFAMAAAPRIQQQVQRDQEQEAIFRGEQVADAILAYYVFRNQQYRANGDQALPTSIDQLESLMISGTIVLVRHGKKGIGFTRHSKRYMDPVWEYVTYPLTHSM